MTSLSPDRTDVFISYSHKDRQHLDRLKTHLAFYERSGLLSVWEDTKLAPGSLRHVEIETAIKKTRVAILLVSADFLASPFIAENELHPLLAAMKTAGVIILPVILSACAFQSTALAQFQAANDPSRPIGRMRKADKEEIWAEIAMTVNTELSKASGRILHRRLGSDYITHAIGIGKISSLPIDLLGVFKDGGALDYTVVDLGTGQKWLTSRLYIFAIMLERMRGLRCFVFLETRDEIDQRFLGIASPTKVRWGLARRYPWLETAFAKAYSDVSDPVRIFSATGALDQGAARQVVYRFLSNPSIQQILPFGMSPDNSEWESLVTEDVQTDESTITGYNIQELWEHAKWLDATRLRQDLGDILQQDESTWLKESPNISSIEQVHSILRRKAPFVALVDQEKRFRSLIDRQDLLERTVANQ